ncbi:hypothetical protein HKX48_005571 [Thoreauomyces humboldtii]|nr:hypothetical protein HKX48_005571 [Thoreauomyces humboldtii]
MIVDEFAEGIKNDLKQYEVDPFESWFGARDTTTGKLVCVVGFELGKDKTHIHGPWVSTDPADPKNKIRRWTMHNAITALPSSTANDFTTFYDLRSNSTVGIAMEDMGFVRENDYSLSMMLKAKDVRGKKGELNEQAARASKLFDVRIVSLEEKDTVAAITVIHNLAFPKYPLKELKDDPSAPCWLFGVFPKGTDASKPVGYALVNGQGVLPAAYLASVGISESLRGQGVGRLLLATVRNWFAEETKLESIGLTVRAVNEGAKRIYVEAGFVEICTAYGHSAKRKDIYAYDEEEAKTGVTA